MWVEAVLWEREGLGVILHLTVLPYKSLPWSSTPLPPGKFHPLQEDAGRLQVAMLHQDLFPTSSTIQRSQAGIAPVKTTDFAIPALQTFPRVLLPDCQRISKCLFQDFLPPKLRNRLYFNFFFPRGMLTHSRENIRRLILAREQSKGEMGRGSPQFGHESWRAWK